MILIINIVRRCMIILLYILNKARRIICLFLSYVVVFPFFLLLHWRTILHHYRRVQSACTALLSTLWECALIACPRIVVKMVYIERETDRQIHYSSIQDTLLCIYIFIICLCVKETTTTACRDHSSVHRVVLWTYALTRIAHLNRTFTSWDVDS